MDDESKLAAPLLLPAVLSVIAGSVDVISFLGLDGLFNAHITGNIVDRLRRTWSLVRPRTWRCSCRCPSLSWCSL